jgi:hypothetical protein
MASTDNYYEVINFSVGKYKKKKKIKNVNGNSVRNAYIK